MLAYVIIGFLAAFGAFSAIWVLLGAWLIRTVPCQVVLFPAAGREEAVAARYLWLREVGLIKGQIALVCDSRDFCLPNGVEQMSWEKYRQELEQERET